MNVFADVDALIEALADTCCARHVLHSRPRLCHKKEE